MNILFSFHFTHEKYRNLVIVFPDGNKVVGLLFLYFSKLEIGKLNFLGKTDSDLRERFGA